MTNAPVSTETNLTRNRIYTQSLSVPHRQISDAINVFADALNADPDWVGRAMVYIALTSVVRDNQEAAITTLLQSDYQIMREAGRCLLLGRDAYNITPADLDIPGLPPYEVLRVLHYLRKSNRKVPRLATSLAHDFAKLLEANPVRFDGVAVRNRTALRLLYTSYHIEPNDYAQAALFTKNPPEGSKLAVLKQIAHTSDPTERMRLVMENNIPYTIAVSVLPKLDAASGIALVSVMSDQEALNSRAWLERSGLLAVPEVKAVYLAKVANATRSVATADHRKSAQGSNAEVQEAVDKAKQRAVDKSEKIGGNVALLIDISGSMHTAIDVAREFGTHIAPLCSGELGVFAFNDSAREILRDEASKHDLKRWQGELALLRAAGNTSIGSGLALALQNGYMPEHIVIVTDCGENSHPVYSEVLDRYAKSAGVLPHTTVINLGNERNDFLTSLERLGYPLDVFSTHGQDYYVFDAIKGVLVGKGAKLLVERINEMPFPARSSVVIA